MAMRAAHRDLPDPVVETIVEPGTVPCAWVGLRTGKAVRTVQPDPDMLVHFCVGSDERPVGFSIFGRIDGAAVARILRAYVAWPAGRTGGAGIASRARPSARRILAVIGAVERAAAALQRAS